ncbi:MAG: right-handed parallel beta-helix repeat-containing protein [Bacteroidota bacterium]|nr:right-handed parallel beta-helix repeat-containing protein [Bacteroidota bacterium]
MIIFQTFLYVLLLSLYCNSVSAETFYISNLGDDTNNGLSPVYPVKSIEKLNSLIFKMEPGDAVLCERGSIFYGQININVSGNENSPLIFGAYGTGKNPVISGSIPVSNWSEYKGGIFKSNVSSEVKDLFVNEKRMTLARYPNSGYLRISTPFPVPNNGFTDNNLKQPAGYWNGSNVRIRTENWAYEYTAIKNFSDGSITFDIPTYYPAKPGWGYYLDNNINHLDTAGEWYFDKNNQNNKNDNLYFYIPDGVNAPDINVQGTVHNYGFHCERENNNIIIQNLEFRNQYIAGVYFAGVTTKLKIENCTFKGQTQTGILMPGKSENNIINNCRFYNITGKGIYLPSLKNTTVSNNIFQSIGMIPGYGVTGDAFSMSAIFVGGDNNMISGNNINEVGHDGINCIGGSNVIEKNVIKNCLLLLNDGAAVKCYGEMSKNSEWTNNFILNVQGNMESTSKKYNQIVAVGFYLDELSNNNTISNNTITGCAFAGIGTNAGYENTFVNNISYNNSIGMSFYQNEILCRNNNFDDNILFCSSEDQIAILNQSLYSSNIPGVFNNNRYLNPASYNIFRIMENNIIFDYNFEKWKGFVRSENNSSLIVSKNILNSNLFLNMSDDSLKVNLNSGISYRDVSENRINNFIIVQPWSSVIIFADSDISNLPEINIASGSVYPEERTDFNFVNSFWYNLMAKNLNDVIVITSPAGFEISLTDDSDFSDSLTLTPENGKTDKIIFVRPTLENSRTNSGYIVNISGNINAAVKISGLSK